MTPSNLLDLTTLGNLVELDDGGHALLGEMLEIFQDDIPRRIQDLVSASALGDAEGFARAAHALKGEAGALGARALRFLAAELENLGRSGSANAGPDLGQRLGACFEESLEALRGYVGALQAGPSGVAQGAP